MNKESCFYIGFISKKIGFKGELSIKINTGNPKNYLNIDFIYVDIDNQLVPYKVNSSVSKKNAFLQIKLKEIINEHLANSLIKKDVFLNKDKFKKKENHFFLQEIINYQIIDQQENNVGLVSDVIDQNLQKLIIVKNKNNQEILIPLVRNFIKKIDKKNKILTVNLPEGIIDLNLKS